MTLDDAFEAKESIANAVMDQVSASMKTFGVQVVRALMTDMEPDAEVAKSMNRYGKCVTASCTLRGFLGPITMRKSDARSTFNIQRRISFR